MDLGMLTYSEALLLLSVGIFSILLTVMTLLCVLKKGCWLYNIIWLDGKEN